MDINSMKKVNVFIIADDDAFINEIGTKFWRIESPYKNYEIIRVTTVDNYSDFLIFDKKRNKYIDSKRTFEEVLYKIDALILANR